ncbi:MAG: hypothetical protein AB201_00110 [Parcubacteria bacterium C7867-006]|nr:MAG: hypothetical protein AB201_00110 [Parcubacteria bacterium C7867-006]
MPSRKIITTIIICLGAIVSIWLLNRASINITKQQATDNSISTYSYEDLENSTSTDWKKILTSLDKKTEDFQDLTKQNSFDYDETTLTAQMSKDFMSQYLLLKKGGRQLTADDIDKITSNIMSSPQYKQLSAPVYVTKNLKISPNNDISSLRNYRDQINLILKNRSLEIRDNPIMVLSSAAKTNNSALLDRLDVIINASNGFIQDFLNTNVPESAISVHLNLMNAVSALVVNTEAMKEIYNDPVRAMMGLSQYTSYTTNFQKRLAEMNSYLSKIK